MATDITEALQGAGAVSAKPVTMEAIPEATIDVGGGSQSLDIEGLGVKRRKDDLSVATASTSGIAVEDLFGDLLDEVNFSDPTSVDAFRESAASRINEFDSNTFSSILGEASTIAGDLATFASGFQGSSQPQQQFEQVFRPLSVTSGDDAGDIGLDTATSTEAQDISSLTNPGLAASLVGSGIGAFGTGASISDFGASLASGALSSTGVAGVFGGFNAAQSLANAEITDIPSALSATSAALSLGQQAANVADLVNSNVTVTGLFEQAAKNVGEYIEGIYTAVTNPAQAMEAYGMEMQYGTQTPALFSYNLPSGQVNFAFDKKTGQLVTPGFIQAMLPAPMRAAFNLAQVGMEAIGYTEEVSDRAVGMANAFSTAGVSFSAPTASSAGMTGFADPSDQTNVTAIDLDFSEVPGAIGSLQFDMNALADQVAGKGVTTNNISIEDINQAAVVQAYLDFEDIDIANAAIQSTFNNYASSRGLDTDDLGQIAEAMNQEAMTASLGFVDAYNSLSEAAGVQGIDIGFGSLADRGMTGLEASTAPATLSAAVASQLQDLSTMGVDELSAIGLSRAGMAASVLSEVELASLRDEPLTALALTQTELERARGFTAFSTAAQEKALSDAASAAATNSFSYGAGGYNSQNPSIQSIEIAERTMEITNTNMMDPNNKEQQEVAKTVALQMARERESINTYGSEAFGQPGFSIDPNFGYEDLSDEDISSGGAGAAADAGPSFDPADEADEGSWDSDGGDGGGGDSKVICTALKDMGLLDKELWQHDGAYGRTLPLETRQGYWKWGVPTAKFIRKNRWAAKAIRPVVTEVAKEMAHRVGYGKGSKLGAALLYVGLPMCRVINRIKNNGNNTRSVYS